jgi:sporulation protein YlmC with PRC-barrel domain
MIRQYSSVAGLPILCIDSGITEYKLAAFVIDPDRLVIELAVLQQAFNPQKHYVMARSVQEIGSHSLIVSCEADISDANDLIRYQKAIEAKPYLIGYRVVASSGQVLGRVKDFSFDTTHLTVNKLIVRSHWTRRLISKDTIINRSQIDKIENKTVVVKETKAKARKTSAKLLPASS